MINSLLSKNKFDVETVMKTGKLSEKEVQKLLLDLLECYKISIGLSHKL